ncbi:hypothetical protein [Roseovarius aestuarii]|uniref:Uncharacterized protein n=1 Tax=Roseovarius aestuarii TaxID=475083 RepID=A0A1X7BMH5_9RHOB|nr:hypothetical protein [Roseovarius aestuarii]SMC10806.1 hypothetical protein ROA7745_00613 [Roseovarius aestuarii]
MLGIFAKTFNTATRTDARNHWGKHDRFNDRRDLDLFPHNTSGKRV